MIVVATAGWSIPRACAAGFSGEGTHLQRYARTLRGVEINSTFYRDHAGETYARWARQTPRNFSFSAKVPRQITHDSRLRAARRPLEQFLGDLAGFGRRLGPLVLQLPPSLVFEPSIASGFFSLFRERHAGQIVCEPRHASWFGDRADALMQRFHVGRVAADPAIVPEAAQPGGWRGIVYYRLHGSPRKYWSVYDPESLKRYLAALKTIPRGTPAWCVFDNTASGGASTNALQMLKILGGRDNKERSRTRRR